MKGIVYSAIPILIAFIIRLSSGQILRPSTINIAAGKPITATSTCGIGLSEPELYCKLASVPGKFGIKGLECDRCNPLNNNKDRNIKYAVDGSERWWQSPPLSRGKQFQKVNITIDLRQEYQVAYVVIKTGNAPRPGIWSLLRSVDNGQTFTPWHHFATSRSECRQIFNTESQLLPTRDDFVQCSIDYSSIPPFENGEIHISLAKDRPGAANFSFSPVLQEWTKATHIRLQFLRVKTLLTDLLPLAREDPTVTRRYFYSIKDISVGAICMCNGHAEHCVETQAGGKYEFACRPCKHNTCGSRCDKCCPFFVQKRWSPGKPCEACNCHQHSSECRYDPAIDQAKRSLDLNNKYEGGGVCIKCQDNTAGVNCEQCTQGYYNPTGVPKTSPDACRPCNCNERFSSGRCYPDTGYCECVTANYGGPRCDRCNEGYYGFPDCRPCDCNPSGTTGRVCGPTGNQCPCKSNFAGSKCDRCAEGYYGYPECRRCNCDNFGSYDSLCHPDSGQCRCRQTYSGRQCNQCNRGFYSFPNCKPCNCDSEGTGPNICDPIFGHCICLKNFAGARCEKCNDGFYRFPDCRDCDCSKDGSSAQSCDQKNGRCKCKSNYVGTRCDNCQLGYYDYPKCIKCACDKRGANHEICDRSTGQCTCKGSYRGLNCNQCRSGYYEFPTCKACQCNPDGIKRISGRPLGDCSYSNTGQCDCKDNVQGLECSECKPGFYNLRAHNPKGCTGCYCNLAGVAAGLANCDERTGQCICKQHVTGTRCETCKVAYFGLTEKKEFGCTGCNCDVGGAYDQVCDSTTGQCRCRPNVEGLDCSRPIRDHYYPDLLSIKAEVEDACVPSSSSNGVAGRDVPGFFQSDPSRQGDDSIDCTPVRFSFDHKVYPSFSWRGYVGFTDLQKKFKVTLEVPKTGRYQVVFNYALNQSDSVQGQIELSPRGQGAVQSSAVTFTSTQVGSTFSDGFAIAGERGQPLTQFMLTQGTWDLTFTAPPSQLLLDYISVVPQQYYTADILERKVNNPCIVNSQDPLCVQYSYISTVRSDFPTVELETGYIITRQGRQQTHVFDDKVVLDQLDFNVMAYLDKTQTRVTEDIKIPKPGNYVLILQYYHPSDQVRTLDVYLRSRRRQQKGTFYLHSCHFKFGCRQVALDQYRRLKIFNANELERRVVTLLINEDTSVAVDSITAIPVEQWNLDYVIPRPLCTTRDKKCISTSYPIPKGAVVFDATADKTSKPPPNILDPSNKLKFIKGPAPLDLVGPIPKAGKYSVVVHYYQPNHVKYTSRATVTSDRAIQGQIDFDYCPNVEGCRAVIQQYDRSTSFDLGRLSASVQLNIPRDKSVWVDYAILVPQDKLTQEVVEANPVSFSKDFLADCAQNSYFIKPYAPEACKKPVFSLATAFNNGTLPCDCDAKGAIESACNKFGGQCHCRPNVIGRKCNKCKTGYYSFPNCYKCQCVFCNEVTGACDCPVNTVGANCGLCLKGTYGYDPIQGCKDCKCDISGVTGSDVSCDPVTGRCPCKPSRTGPRCNKCALGRYGYPHCNTCDCDKRGVLSDICDVKGVCLCKPGAVGRRCDKCSPGTYNLDTDNPNGCMPCWCSGLSKICKSALLQRTHIRQMKNWTIENTRAPVVQHTAYHLIVKVAGKRTHQDKPIYWVAPTAYTGNKVYSYGGQLRYSIKYDVPVEVSNPVLTIKPDVIIKGKNGMELKYKEQLKLEPKVHNLKVQLRESFWTVGNNSHVGRADFMSVLVDIESIKLRASYSTSVAEVGVLDVQMDYAARIPGQQSFDAREVEQCVCPVKAAGSSCEKCGKHYTRGADNKTCVPCQCYGHSKDCHPETGECYNCMHNTTGERCQTCVKGFYGNPLSGSPSDCRVCRCPLGISTNSFASECKLDDQKRLMCVCHQGYTGKQCEQCADGYYGDPTLIGDKCKPCMCNGNIDPSVPDSCDPFTGKCTKCTNKAVGDHCERCRDGYYGDAVVAKNCQKCQCDTCGAMTTLCNYISGSCQCKNNVLGSTCNTCKPNTWNFDSCLGCEDCNCGNASLGSSCTVKTGQCLCKPGAIGRRCDRCQAGYWDYKTSGCQACNCPGGPENLWGFCDVNTGQCCKPGGNCTICPPNYILTRSGCEYCGECVGRLLKTATGLDKNITRVLEYLKKGAAGVIAEAKFRDLNDTLQKLIPPTNAYSHTMETVSVVVGISILNNTAVPLPYARYPFSKKTAGKDTSSHSRPDAVLSKVTYVSSPNGPDTAVTLGGNVKEEYIEIENNGNLNPSRSTSILIWVQHKGQVGPILDFGFKKFRIWVEENNAFEVNIPSKSIANMRKSPKTEVNKWHHIAITYDYDSGMSRFYLNEALVDESNIGRTGVDMGGTVVRIGTIPNLYDYFAGAVSCLQIFDESLDVKQIAVLKRACSPDFVQPILSSGKSLLQRSKVNEKKTNEMKDKVSLLQKNAKQSSNNAKKSKTDALILEQDIRDALNRSRGIINLASGIADNLKSGSVNQSLLLKEAESILKELQNRDFTALNDTVNKELDTIASIAGTAKMLLNETLSLHDQAAKAKQMIAKLKKEFMGLLDASLKILKNASMAEQWNEKSKKYDSMTPIMKAQAKKKVMKESLKMVQRTLREASSSLMYAMVAFESFNGSFARLDDLIRQVYEKFDNLTMLINDLQPWADRAANHSEVLRKHAKILKDLLADTEQFSEKAINASKAYINIAAKLNQALAIAREAEGNAMQAQEKSKVVNTRAKVSNEESQRIQNSSIIAKDKVENELQDLLNNLKDRIEQLKKKIMAVEGDLGQLNDTFDEIAKHGDMGKKALSAERNATDSQMVADDAYRIAVEIEGQLPELQELKKSIVYANGNISETEKEMFDAVNKSLNIRERVIVVRKKQTRILVDLKTEVLDVIREIQDMISESHDRFRSLDYVMDFTGETVTNVLPPPIARDSSSFKDIELFIKPYTGNGLLLYFGSTLYEKKTRLRRQSTSESCEQDLISLELKDSQVVANMCISRKLTNITSTEKLQIFDAKDTTTTKVAVGDLENDPWYKIHFTLAGGTATLKIEFYSSNKKDVKTYATQTKVVLGENAVYRIDKTNSYLLIGGIPNGIKVPPEVTTVNYRGPMDGLRVDFVPVGLWDAEKLIKPSIFFERKAFKTQGGKGYQFYGKGYIKGVSGGSVITKISFSFKTTESSGLLFLGGTNKIFSMVDIFNSSVRYTYDQGYGIRTLVSNTVVNDGKFHQVAQQEDFLGRKFDFILDKEVMAKNKRYYEQPVNLDGFTTELISFGGAPRGKIPTRLNNTDLENFSGCLSKPAIQFALTNTLFGIIDRSCKVLPVRYVTMIRHNSYLAVDAIDLKMTSWTLAITFQTKAQTGIILHQSHDKSDLIGLGLEEGKVVLTINPGMNYKVTVKTQKTYNDGKWHFITIHYNRKAVVLCVDKERGEDKFFRTNLIIQTHSDLFVGGVAKDTQNVRMSARKSLIGGTLRDLSFNGREISFLNYKKKLNVLFDEEDFPEPRVKDLIIKKPTTPPPQETPTEPPTAQTAAPSTAAPETTIPTTTAEPSTAAPTAMPTTPTTAASSTAAPVPTTPMTCVAGESVMRDKAILDFGSGQYSHAVYSKVKANSVMRKILGAKTKIYLAFRTVNPEGILFYAADKRHRDFVTCYLTTGKVKCVFSPGSGVGSLVSTEKYNDGQWHSLLFSRKQINGTLRVDNVKVATGSSKKGASNLDNIKDFYVGGVPKGYTPNRISEKKSRWGFPGCIANFTVSSKAAGKPTNTNDTKGCMKSPVESGVYFDEGYIVTDETFAVGVKKTIMLEIKPTVDTASIFSVISPKGDFLVLELIKGELIFRMENGNGPNVVRYKPSNEYGLCDGRWHRIRIVKDSMTASLTVDNNDEVKNTGKGPRSAADVNHPFYFGGVQDGYTHKALGTTKRFKGCMRSLVVSSKNIPLYQPVRQSGDVYLGGCPASS